MFFSTTTAVWNNFTGISPTGLVQRMDPQHGFFLKQHLDVDSLVLCKSPEFCCSSKTGKNKKIIYVQYIYICPRCPLLAGYIKRLRASSSNSLGGGKKSQTVHHSDLEILLVFFTQWKEITVESLITLIVLIAKHQRVANQAN